MRTLAVLPLLCLLAAPAGAQDPFKQVWVTQSDSGEIVRGRIVDLSKESLSILTPDNRRVEMPIDRVLRIEARGDSLKNGGAFGAGVMAGITTLSCLSWGAEAECIPMVLVETGLGALIGAGIDALNSGRTAIYVRPGPGVVKSASGSNGKSAAIGFRVRF